MVSESLKRKILGLIDILIKFSTSSYDDKDMIEYGYNILYNIYRTSIPTEIPVLYKKIRILTISRLINITLEAEPGEIDIGRMNDKMYGITKLNTRRITMYQNVLPKIFHVFGSFKTEI